MEILLMYKCIKKQGGTMNLFHTGHMVLDKNAYYVSCKGH